MQWQDDFYGHMAKEFPDLDRGKPAVQTGREHIPMWMCKKAENLNRDSERIKDALANINAFNAPKKREDAIKILSAWVPQVQNFTSHIESIERDQQELWHKQMETEYQAAIEETGYENLISDYNSLVNKYNELLETLERQNKLLEQIPPEIFEQLKKTRKHGFDERER